MKPLKWIGLVSPQGCTEYNARFVIGESAEKLENGKWYTNQELADLHGGALFLRDSSGAVEKTLRGGGVKNDAPKD